MQLPTTPCAPSDRGRRPATGGKVRAAARCAIRWTHLVADALQIHVTTARFRKRWRREMRQGRAAGGKPVGPNDLQAVPGWWWAGLCRHRRPVRHPPRRYGRRANSAPGGSARSGTHRSRRLARAARPADAGRPGDRSLELGFQGALGALSSFRTGHSAAAYRPLAKVAETTPEAVRGIQQGLTKRSSTVTAASAGTINHRRRDAPGWPRARSVETRNKPEPAPKPLEEADMGPAAG